MNILILTTHLNKGGISRYVINLAKGLSLQGHKVFIASSGGEWVSELRNLNIMHKDISIKTKSICSLKILFSFFALSGFIITNKIDIIHANTRVTQFLAYLLYKKSKIPYLSSFHGFYRPKKFRKLFKFSGLLAIAVSKSVSCHLKEDLEIDPDIIKVVYNGIDLESSDQGISKRSQAGLSSDDFILGILGRISAEKGHLLAVEALSRLVPKYDNLFLLLSGRGKHQDKLNSLIDNLKLEKKVKFIDSEAADFLKTINILLVPSEKEGFGFAVVEAFAGGVAVIGYNTGGIAEIIQNRSNGILFNHYDSLVLADAIEELMTKGQLRQRMVAKAKEDVHNYSLENMASGTLRVYAGAIDLREKSS
mgnify:CR=1 FL=1|tara:strand:- start:191 stop:1282 length:1092 start_codon:yes stop_codon:yes gene_type:complete